MSRLNQGQPDVSLRLLEIFAAMMRAPTTIEAAELLKISQPAVSAGIRQLEVQLGITLFERTNRRLTPTAEAHQLYEEIRPVFGMMRGFTQRARDIRLGLAGRLRIMATPPLGNSLAPRALQRLLENRPEVSISFDVRRLEHVIDAVQSGVADVGLALAQHRLETVNVDVLHRAHMVALVPEGGPLAQQAHVSAVDLQPFPLVGLEQESNLGQLVRQAFEQSGAEYQPHVEVRYCQTAAMLATHGLGTTVVDPWSALAYPLPGLVQRPFVPACEVRAVMLTRKGVPHSGLVHSFQSELREVALEMAPG